MTLCAQDPRSHSFDEDTAALPVQPTRDESLAYGLNRNPALRAAYSRYLAAVERVTYAKALPDPNLRVTYLAEEIQTRTGPQESQIALTQTVPWFGKLHSRKAIASTEAEALWWQFDAMKLALTRDIENTYTDYAYLGKAIELTGMSLEFLRKIEPIVEDKVRAGSDLNALLRLQVEIGRTDDNLRQLQQRKPVVEARFNALLHRGGSAPFPWFDLRPEADDHRFVSALPVWDRIRQNNPLLASLAQNHEGFVEKARLARLDGYPDITFGLNYFETGSALLPGTPGSGEDPYGFTVAFNLPVWRNKYRSAQQAAHNNAEAVDAQLQNAENHLQTQYTEYVSSLKDAQRRVGLYEKDLLPKARQAREVTRTDYQAGRASVLDYIDSQRTLLDLELIYWRAVADTLTHRSNLQSLYSKE